MTLKRSISFADRHIEIADTIQITRPLNVIRLEKGRRFVAIHMASSRYFGSLDSAIQSADSVLAVDAGELTRKRCIEVNQSWSF